MHQSNSVAKATCRSCHKRIEGAATTCLYCHSDLRGWTARHAPLVVVGSVLLSLVMLAAILNVWRLLTS
jgi:hypothetical protein